MVRKATQIVVPFVGSKEQSIYERSMKDLNEKLRNSWKIFSTYTFTNNHITYLVYVLTKSETEKHEEVEG